MPKLPTITDLYPLIRAVKADIQDDYRASCAPEDDAPGIQLTIGASPDGSWSYQTGDNQFMGGAYFYPHWAVVGVYRASNCRELARDIREQLEEAFAQFEDCA